MRKLKFRAWDGKNMVTIGWYMRPESGEIIKESFFYNQEADLIPMQFTGLKDKNGKEIYEGDIVEHEFYPTDMELGTDSRNYDVGFGGGAFCIGNTVMYDWFDDKGKLSDIEVIGNIYENKELLDTYPKKERKLKERRLKRLY